MRGMAARFMVASALCATVALGTPAAAFADSKTTTTTGASQSNGNWMSAESAYLAHRHSIRVTYRTTVNVAHNNFTAAMSKARNNRARNAARTTLLNTIASADADQNSALASLVAAPEASGELDTSEYLLERQAVNQDYADVVDAVMATYHAEVAAATSSAQLVTERANLRLGIAKATMVRSSALVALGSRSSKVLKPVKVSNVGSINMGMNVRTDN